MYANIHLRGVDSSLLDKLKQTAMAENTSMNKLILRLLQEGLGIKPNIKHQTYHDLDNLAGTWSKKEAEKFMDSIQDFECIDEALWK